MSQEKITLRTLSEATGISTSTLSRALNNCAGVDADTRRTAQKAAAHLGYTPPPRRRGEAGIILPSVPEYFWQEANSTAVHAMEEQDMPYRLAVYAPTGGDEALISLIDSMAKENVRALLLPIRSPAVAAYLCGLRNPMTVFQLTDYGKIPNSFVFSSDGYKDGAALADAVTAGKSAMRIVQLYADTELSRARMAGFASRCTQECLSLPLPEPYSAHTAADIARLLAASCADPPDLVICNDGILPAAALAVIKCRWKGHTRCAGYEFPPSLRRFIGDGMIAALMEQDVCAAAVSAVRAAVRYLSTGECPPEKFTRHASKLYVF